MKTSFKTLLTLSAAVLLAACGGGDAAAPSAIPNLNTNPNLVATTEASFSNAGVFVPNASSSATFNLVNCKYSGDVVTSVNAGTATLIITANGNMTFNHPGDAVLALAPISRTLSASTASEAELQISASAGETSNRYSAYLLNVIGASGSKGDSVDEIRFNFNPSHDYINFPDPTSAQRVRYSTSGIELECGFANGTVMTSNFGNFNARIAAATAGIVTANQQNTTGTARNPLATLAYGYATWTNDRSGGTDRYSRLNFVTGQLLAGASASGVFTPIDIAAELLPSNGANSPFYSERKEGITKTIDFRVNGGIKNTRFDIISGTDLLPFANYNSLR